jgi:molybdopterin molybdotransferase
VISIEEAIATVFQHACALPARSRPLLDALDCRLAEDVAADADQPPFDKALVDGYAIRVEESDAGRRRFRIGETILAGQVPTHDLQSGEAAVIMTGAPTPGQTNAVVMHEQTTTEGSEVWIDLDPVKPEHNLLRQGRICKAGDLLLSRGEILTPPRLALLASVGRPSVQVIPRVEAAILSTGDELVEPDQTPGPGQIRNSNTIMLEALARSAGASTKPFPIVPDEPAALRRAFAEGLESDVMLITGGVSAGQRDLVPSILSELDVERKFHKIRLKPGKPLWFGVGPRRGDRPGTLVFGLPGNPVSGLVGFLLFVKPAMRILEGHAAQPAELLKARLGHDFQQKGDRVAYHPARWAREPGSGVIEPLRSAGSADLWSIAPADGFAVFPAGDRLFREGEIVGFLPLR